MLGDICLTAFRITLTEDVKGMTHLLITHPYLICMPDARTDCVGPYVGLGVPKSLGMYTCHWNRMRTSMLCRVLVRRACVSAAALRLVRLAAAESPAPTQKLPQSGIAQVAYSCL